MSKRPSDRPSVQILVGAQWGDEGKGKWIDYLTENVDLVVRYQGGNNAGHTLYVDNKKIVLHLLPSGVLHQGRKGALAAGVVVNPSKLLEEFADVKSKFPEVNITPDNLWLSGRCHVITPWHIEVDTNRESATKTPLGTTKRGIGPTYADRAHRTGLRLGHYVDGARRAQWIATQVESIPEFAAFYKANPKLWQEFDAAANKLAGFVCDAEHRIREAAKNGTKVLIEGAQGALLDLDHGTYPFVTSSSTTAGGACQSIGLPPQMVGDTIGIAKAYLTRVGTGPFPTELHDQTGKTLQEKGHEFGATTGRPRRCGWLDAVALRYAVDINGLDGMVLNKFDILSEFPEVKLCVAYKHPKLGELKQVPWDSEVMEECEPVYKTFKGWQGNLSICKKYEDLPTEARDFITAVESEIGCPVRYVGVGPARSEAIYRD
jgi:adenylosuccinate synthase